MANILNSIIKNHIPEGRPNRPQAYINPSYITIRDAESQVAYADALYYADLLNTDDTVGAKAWHYTVDALNIVEHLPTDEMALHLSNSQEDPGNITSTCVTICRNAGGNRTQAEQNAIDLVRYLMALYAIPSENIVTQQYFDETAPATIVVMADFILTLQQRDENVNPDRHLFIFDKSEILRTVLTNGSPGACPFFDAVHKEQINGVNTLEFTMPAQHEDAMYIMEENMVALQDMDEDFYQLFVIKEVEEVHESTAYKRAFCEHAALELVDEIIEDRRPQNETARNLLATLLINTRWNVGIASNMGTVPLVTFYYESVLSGIHKIIDAFKCEVRYRVKLTGGEITGRYVDLLQSRGHATGRRFQYSRDMKKVYRKADSTMVKTALYGRGKGEESGDGYGRRLTFADVAWDTSLSDVPTDKPLGQEWIGDPDALAAFGRFNSDGSIRHRFGIYENEEQTDPEELLKETWEALQQNKVPLVEYSMEVIDLEKVTGYASEKVRLGDAVICIDQEFNPPLAVEARVIELSRRLDEPEKAEVLLGNFVPKITNTLARLERVEKKVRDKEGVWDGKVGAPDGILDTLRAEVRAGQGTVKLSHNDGIIITDNDYSPTKAMRLLGGIFALANSKDPVTGEWNWTTFGTADGFTADMITAGQMSFDRASGGTLTLGGPGNGYGRLKVASENGEVIADLDATVGGFTELYVGNLISNTPTVNYDTYTIYVDGINGQDNYNGLSPERPLRTIQKAIDRLPSFSYGSVTIQMAAGQTYYEGLGMQGFHGSGNIVLNLNGAMLDGYIVIHGNGQEIIVQGGVINLIRTSGNEVAPSAAVFCMNSRVSLYTLGINANALAPYGVLSAHSYVYLYKCDVHNAKNEAIAAIDGGTVFVQDCTGKGLNSGLKADGASIIAGSGTAPDGVTVDTITTNGGQIRTTFTHTQGTANASYSDKTNLYSLGFDNVAVWSETQGWATEVKGFMQGAGENFGNTKSLAFLNYQDFIEMKWSANGGTVLKSYILLKRLAQGGHPKEVPLYLWLHNYAQAPFGEPTLVHPIGELPGLAWGEYRWVEIPTWACQQILDGNAKGFALYSPDGGSYAKFSEHIYELKFKVIFKFA